MVSLKFEMKDDDETTFTINQFPANCEQIINNDILLMMHIQATSLEMLINTDVL